MELRSVFSALAVSIAVHLAFVGWMGRVSIEPPKKITSGEFVFIEPPPQVEPPPPEPSPAPEPAPRVQRQRRAPTPAPLQDAPTVPAAPSPQSDLPTREPPVKVNVSLLPSSSFAVALDAGVDVDTVPAQQGLRALAPPKDLVGDLAKETIGRGRVDRGLVHPYYSQLGKALLKNWDADRVAKSGLKGLAEQTSENMKLYNEIWSDRAAAYGKSGNPMGDVAPSSNRRAPTNDRIMGLPGVDMDQRKELQRQLKEAYKMTRRAVIRVVQDLNGKLLKVELVEPSNDSKVDKEALVDVRAAAMNLPLPPAEAVEGKTTLSSLWSFELVVSISPPVPTFTFEFDEALGFIDMRLPLDRRIYKKVRLVAVE